MPEGIYKICSHCQHKWLTEEDFLMDADIEVVGYQMSIQNLAKGLFLFNHLSCRSTISKKVDTFYHLYDGVRYPESKTGSESCPGHCFNENDFSKCANSCEGAFIREILNILKNYKKENQNSDTKRPMIYKKWNGQVSFT